MKTQNKGFGVTVNFKGFFTMLVTAKTVEEAKEKVSEKYEELLYGNVEFDEGICGEQHFLCLFDGEIGDVMEG